MELHDGVIVVEPKSGGDFAVKGRVYLAHVVLLLLFGDVVPVAVIVGGALFSFYQKTIHGAHYSPLLLVPVVKIFLQ